ncbi:hypothetical protein RHECNPAF_1700076 [Rhizobium etli CNPAF512]|nr:hypothetical protein RHECNPAF_1700076 [Rhizobium etli CNPAF512]
MHHCRSGDNGLIAIGCRSRQAAAYL